ncbi:MAG: cytochrome c3 family protein [Acidobacteria bacterium]|nr:cytochrome c3 family protein [Acidobacteriota bacterium]
MVKRGLVVLSVLSIVVLALAAEIPADKQVLTYDVKLGKVTFEHGKHAGFEGVACVDCHHKTEGAAVPEKCGACHPAKVDPAKPDVPKLQDAVHGNCWECHQKNADGGKKHGPLKGAKNCKECHVKAQG